MPRIVSYWEKCLLEKHVTLLEKSDWGVSQPLAEVPFLPLQQLSSEWTTYQKLVGLQIRPEIEAKIKFVGSIYRQKARLNYYREAEDPPTI